ncbi:MAG TPA: heme-binding domain-containing protein [Bryobacteraceae bacterium]|nr:heme-binding domain-containing protein [Bryobacteraceae bacterium]
MAKKIVVALLLLFVAAQFVPDTFFPISNPGVDRTRTLQAKARKLTPEVSGILNRSCRDCHSNETAWPWYSKVAPVSWLLSHDVAEGRRELNFSEWGGYNAKRVSHELEEMCEQVERGDMPLSYYTPLHPDAKLSSADREAVCSWTRDEKAAVAAAP